MKRDLCLRPSWQFLGTIRLEKKELTPLVIKR